METTDMSDYDSPSCTEYVYDKKAEGRAKALKVLLICGYVVFVLAFFLVCYVTRVIPVFALCPIFTRILVYYTWPIVSYDVYYTFEHGHMEFGKIKKRKRESLRSAVLTLDVQRASVVAAYSDVQETEEFESVSRVHDFASSYSSKNLIAIVFENAGEREAVVFENTPKLARLLISYSSVAKNVSYNE
jgi:hypothetical protein